MTGIKSRKNLRCKYDDQTLVVDRNGGKLYLPEPFNEEDTSLLEYRPRLVEEMTLLYVDLIRTFDMSAFEYKD